MIFGLTHPGSGLGNQLHRLVGTKIIAMEKGEKHSMIGQEFFKAKDFINLDLEPNNIKYTIEYPAGKVIPESYEGVIDGEFQSEKDFIKHLDKIREWLKTEEFYVAPDTCVINFRGGEYTMFKDLFLPQKYWDMAIKIMKAKGVEYFIVATDDPKTAKKFFPNYIIVSGISKTWQMVRYAYNLILSNSSFAILPAHLNENAEEVLCPKFWAGYNKKEWVNPDNEYSKFTYLHHEENPSKL